jgi:hypothetical protein
VDGVDALSDGELNELDELVAECTPGPWYPRLLDDEHHMQLVAVSTEPDPGFGRTDYAYPDFDARTVVAATLVQQPSYVLGPDSRPDQNAAFIALARTAVPRLIAELRHRRAHPTT